MNWIEVIDTMPLLCPINVYDVQNAPKYASMELFRMSKQEGLLLTRNSVMAVASALQYAESVKLLRCR